VNGNKVYSKEFNEKYTDIFPGTLAPEFDVGLKRDDNTVINGSLSQLYLFDRVLRSEEVVYVRGKIFIINILFGKKEFVHVLVYCCHSLS
jgi:hypothetical protein